MQFVESLGTLVKRLKFIDESGAHLGLTRLFARAAPGQRLVEATPGYSGPHYTLVATLGWKEVTAPWIFEGAREPLQLRESDLMEVDLVIALDAAEHRPLMARRFAAWSDWTVYWQVPDLHLIEAENGLSRIESNVTQLIQTLSSKITLSEQAESG